MVPIRYMIMIWVPMVVMRLLPIAWWGLTIDLFLLIWIISLIKNSTHPLYQEYQTFPAFVFFNVLYASIILWLDSTLAIYICSFLIVLSFATQFHHIKNVNKNIK